MIVLGRDYNRGGSVQLSISLDELRQIIWGIKDNDVLIDKTEEIVCDNCGHIEGEQIIRPSQTLLKIVDMLDEIEDDLIENDPARCSKQLYKGMFEGCGDGETI